MNQPTRMTPEQLRQARHSLGWSLEQLAFWSDTSATFIATYENEDRVVTVLFRQKSFDALAVLRTTLEESGVEFTDGDGGSARARLRDIRSDD